MLYHPFNQHLKPLREQMNWKGGDPETVETLPDWMKPYIQFGMDTVQDAYESGSLSGVAPFTPDQQTSFDALQQAAGIQGNMLNLGSDIAQGGAFTDTEAMKDAAAYRAQVGRKGEGYTGGGLSSVGGGRDAVRDAVFDAELAAQFAGIDYEALRADQARQDAARQEVMGGATMPGETLGTSGTAQQEQRQAEIDANFQGLERMASLFGLGNQAQQQATGGK